MSTFLEEINQLRSPLPAKLQTERNLREYQNTQRLSLQTRLLNMEEEAIEEYYQQCKTKLRYAAANNEDLYVSYTFDRQEFNPIHQRIIQKFQADGIDAYHTRRGYCAMFCFRNIG